MKIELPEPEVVEVEIKGQDVVTLDLLEAYDTISTAQEKTGKTQHYATAQAIRPWLAEKLEVEPDALKVNQVIGFVKPVIERGNAFYEDLKKKPSTTAS